jgi:hypothetical protein
MNSKSELEGGSGNGASIAPLEPGRAAVMPNPPGENSKPLVEQDRSVDDEGAAEEEDMGDVDINNSVSRESPPQQ